MTDINIISGQGHTPAPVNTDKTDQLNDNCASDGMDAISQINDLMLKLAEMFKNYATYYRTTTLSSNNSVGTYKLPLWTINVPPLIRPAKRVSGLVY